MEGIFGNWRSISQFPQLIFNFNFAQILSASNFIFIWFIRKNSNLGISVNSG